MYNLKCEGMCVNIHICVHEHGVMCMCARVRIHVHQCIQAYVYKCVVCRFICTFVTMGKMHVYLSMCMCLCTCVGVYACMCGGVCVHLFLHV